MFNSPQFLEQMAGVMSNPQLMETIIASDPRLAAMGPQALEMFRSDRFRQLLYVSLQSLLSTTTDISSHIRQIQS